MEDLRYRSKIASAIGNFGIDGRLYGFPYHVQVSDRVAEKPGRGSLTQIRRSIEKNLNTYPSPHTKSTMAVLQLLAGKPDEAIKLLGEATSVNSPEKAQFLSDLSVAYLTRAELLGKPHDITRALDSASLALEIAPGSSEACFNRALALDRLQLVVQAEKAWEDCLSLERDPEWRNELQRHLIDLRRALKPGVVNADVTNCSEVMLEATIAADLQGSRIKALETILPNWGKAFLNGRHDEAGAALSRGRAIGRILARLDGDYMVAEVFEGIAGEASSLSGSNRLAALAEGSLRYRDARKNLISYETDVSKFLFEEARSLFIQAGSPMKTWAELGAVSCYFYKDDFDRALARLRAIWPEIDASHFPTLAAYWHWLKGMTHSRQGDLRASLRDFESTVRFFRRTGEKENLGGGYQLVGEIYRLLGNEDQAWYYRMRSLDLLRETPTSRRRLMVLRDVSESLLAEGRSRSALAFQDEAVQIASGSGNYRDLAEMLLWRAQALVQLNKFKRAQADLEEAQDQAAQIIDTDLRERTVADIGLAKADLESRRNPRGALPLFKEPADAYRRKGHILPLATLLLRRAKLTHTLGLHAHELENLDEGIDLFERQWQSLDNEADRVSFLETAQDLYDSRISLDVKGGDVYSALEFSERARAFWTGSPGSVDTKWVQSLGPMSKMEGDCSAVSILPTGVVVLEYALVEGELFLWLLRCDGVRFTFVEVSSGQVSELTNKFRAAAQMTPPSLGHFVELANSAYDLLLQKVEDDIRSAAVLIFIPDKDLHGIPFAALRNRATGRFLIEDHEVFVAPNVAFLERVWASPTKSIESSRVLLVSPTTPDLKRSEEEIEDLRRLYDGAQVLVGSNIQKNLLLQDLDHYTVLHYAGHAEVDPLDPFRSRLPLAVTDGSEAITAQDLQGKLFKQLEFVVLSACGSVTSAPTRTGGFLGLARPFLTGGVRAVVGTIWDIEDEASRSVLVAFHRHLRSNRSPATALRKAQLQHLQEGWSPSVWAAFVIVGDGLGANPAL